MEVKMRKIKNLIGKEYKTLREKVNIYTGMVLGPAIPIAATYGLLSGAIEPKSLAGIVLKAGIAVLVNTPFILSEICGGTVLGIRSANQLRNKEIEKKNLKSKLY